MSKVVAIGQPANEAERQAIAYLRDRLPDTYTILHNFEIHQGRESSEVDLVVIAPHAIYLVDVNGTSGNINVDGGEWYPARGRSFTSPLQRLRRTANVLIGLLNHDNPDFREVYITVAVVLTAADARLSDPARLDATHTVTLDNCVRFFQDASRVPDQFLSEISKYSDAAIQAIQDRAKPSTRSAQSTIRVVSEEPDRIELDGTPFEQLLLEMSRVECAALAEKLARERANCLRREQAEQIAVNPTLLYTSAWQDHVATCERCRVLLQSCRETMWHPTWSQLSLWLLNRLSPTETAQLVDHVQWLDCQRCKSIAADQFAKFVQVATAFTLKNLRVPAAASDQLLDVSQALPDDLEVELSEEDGQIVIDVRTQREHYDGQLVAYAIWDSDGKESYRGFMLLRRRMPSWISAECKLDYMKLYDEAGARFEIVVFPVDAHALTRGDRDLLLETVAADLPDKTAVEAWKSWVGEARASRETLNDEVGALIDEVEQTLA